MSTRSIIKIVDNQNREIKLYHHCNGYLSGVGFDLLDMFYSKGFNKLNVPTDINIVANKLIRHPDDAHYEVTAYKHGDIEYLYEINVDDNTIKAYDGYGENDPNMKDVTRELFTEWKQDRGVNVIENGQIKAIQTIRTKLGYTTEEYHQLLNMLYGVKSCKKLTYNQANECIKVLETLLTGRIERDEM